jgi:hypothetical protein
MLPGQFNSKLKSVLKMESAEDQFLTIFIRIKNMIEESTRWPQMTKW